MQRKTIARLNDRARAGRRTSSSHRGVPAVAALLAMSLIAPARAQSVADQVGLTALIQRLGSGNQPTGAGVTVGQVEAQETAGNAYPNSADPEFAGKTFIAGSGAFGVSAHATLVGKNFYGSNSIAPGITQIHAYNVYDGSQFINGWLQCNFLLTDGQSACASGPPLPPPNGMRVINNSWIGAFGDVGVDNNVLRRADLVADRDDILIVNGVNNGDPTPVPLMTYGFNGLAVGMLNGTHTSGLSVAPWDGPGRSKPEIVAPNSFTSFSAPIVSAGGALMYQVAQTGPGLSSNPNARKSELIKAVLLAGANHGAVGSGSPHNWSNNPATSGPTRGLTTTPLDPVYGADLLNVDRSHRILTGLEQNGSASVPAAPNATFAGWDVSTLAIGGVLNYRFRVHQSVENVSILATWHRAVTSFSAVPPLANFELELKRIDATGAAVSLLGDAGLPHFTSGNVASRSSVDNLEHIFVRNLAAGDYIIELRRINDSEPLQRDVAIAWIMPQTFKTGDINRDGVVNVTDLLAVIGAWGNCPLPCPPACAADTNSDCAVNVTDLLAVIANWG